MSEVADPIPPDVRAVINLFAGALDHVSFPGVDHECFEHSEALVRACVEEVEAIQHQLLEARRRLDDMQGTLRKTAEVGLAYARVFAAENPELTAVLDTIQIGRKPPARRRRRKRREADPEVSDGQLSLAPAEAPTSKETPTAARAPASASASASASVPTPARSAA